MLCLLLVRPGGSQLPPRVTAPVDGRPKPKQDLCHVVRLLRTSLTNLHKEHVVLTLLHLKQVLHGADARGTRLKNAVKGGAKTGGKVGFHKLPDLLQTS